MSGLLTHLIWVYPSGPDIQGLWCKSAEHWRLLELEGTDLFVWFVQSPRRKWKFFISACLLVCLSKGVFKSTRRQASLIVTGWSSRGGRREVAGWGGRWDTQTPASSGCTLIWKVRIIAPCMNYRFFFPFVFTPVYWQKCQLYMGALVQHEIGHQYASVLFSC